jgi:deoxyribodipyrimidine photo-lyase
MTQQRILIWYRTDLRLQDHKPLHTALSHTPQVVGLYCFDPCQFGQTAFGFPKTGSFRTQFLRESVQDLRQGWRSHGGDLLVRWGEPETVIPDLVQALEITDLYYYREITAEEQAVEQAVAAALEKMSVTMTAFWGATLYHLDDLPFALDQVPEVFTQFRKQVEARATVVSPLPAPQKALTPPTVEPGEIPILADLGLHPVPADDRAVLSFQGGETAGLARLQTYIWERDCLRRYKETRNGMLGADYSSKFSPWLALGCLSPRTIYQAVQRYEAERVKNDSTYWLVFELLWRDYFRWIAAKHGDRLFYPSGLRGLAVDWKQDWPRFEQWCQGQTGFPLVDANMRELAATGFMSNRGRQNVASFLTKNLGIDWRMGAEWFESLLIDYDPCSNYGNWNYTAGVGNDARGFRYFNIPKQSKDYDPKGHYVKHWLAELVNLPTSKVHQPWTLTPDEQTRYNLRLGVDYPHPIVDLEKSVRSNEVIYNAALAHS